MAGSNPQLAIRIAANTDELKRNLAEGRAAIEALGPSVAKMTAAWNTNAAAVVQKAQNITAALQGVSLGTLTASDAAKNLKALDIALAQIKASGAPIPPLMQQTADQLRQVSGAASAGVAPVQSLTSKLQGVAGTLGLAFGAAAAVAGLKSLISNTFTYAETIKDTSDKMGVSMEATQRWGFAAEQTGASLENVSKSVLKLSQGIAGGDKGLKEALAAAGVQFDALRGMKPEDAFNAVAAAIGKIENPMLQAKVALEAFGKSGTELLPAIRGGFVAASDAAKVMSDATINRLDDAKDAWASLGRTVTIISGEILAGTASAVSQMTQSWTRFFQFADIALKQGILAAVQFANAIDVASNSTSELSASSKMYAEAAAKAGDSAKTIAASLSLNEKSVQLFLDSLKKAPPVLDNFGNKHKDTAKKLGESWSGAFGDIFNYSKAWQAEQDALAASMSKVSWSGTAADIDKFNFALRETLNLTTGISWSGVEADLTNLRGIFNNEGTQSGQAFLANFQAAMSNLGSVIVGAIQGGGNVLGSIFASLGAGLGADLGKGLTGALSGLGPTLAGAIGGLLGPLGAMVGNWVGGLFTNQGRNDAKSYAASFGGFDALQAKMLTLGPAYDKLWRDLTQNTKGPAQVAAAIKAIEDAFRAQEAAAASAAGASATAFAGPAGAAGFPTKAQLQQAAKDAEETYRYIKDSGEYTAASVDEAFQRWQDSLIAAGDAGAAALKKIDAEMKSLQSTIDAEAWEEEMGNDEKAARARLAQLEDEKAAALVKIEEEQRAEEAAAAAAEASAEKAFDKTLADAKLLDGEMRRIFSQGYDIPFRFTGGPGGSGGSGGAGYGGAQANGGDYRVDKPTWFMAGEAGPERATFTPLRSGGGGGGGDQTIIVHVDGEVIARAAAKGMPRYLKLHGRGR